MAIFGESYILYFHHNISNLCSSWRFHRVRKKRDSTVQNNPPTIKKKYIFDFEECCWRRDIPHHHIVIVDVQNKEFPVFSPTKGTILYWNKLKSIPSTRVLWKFKLKLVQLFHRWESESRNLRREILTLLTKRNLRHCWQILIRNQNSYYKTV